MLSSTLWRYIYYAAFQQFKHCLLYSFSRYVPGDGGVVALAGNLVYLVYEDYAPLRKLNIVVALLQEAGNDGLHILSNVASLCEHSCIYYCKGNVQHFCYCLGKQCLAGAGWANKQHIGFLQQRVVVCSGVACSGSGAGRGSAARCSHYAFVVVIDRYGDIFLGIVLANNILVQKGCYLLWLKEGEALGRLCCRTLQGALLCRIVQRVGYLSKLVCAICADIAKRTSPQQGYLGAGPSAYITILLFALFSHGTIFWILRESHLSYRRT